MRHRRAPDRGPVSGLRTRYLDQSTSGTLSPSDPSCGPLDRRTGRPHLLGRRHRPRIGMAELGSRSLGSAGVDRPPRQSPWFDALPPNSRATATKFRVPNPVAMDRPGCGVVGALPDSLWGVVARRRRQRLRCQRRDQRLDCDPPAGALFLLERTFVARTSGEARGEARIVATSVAESAVSFVVEQATSATRTSWALRERVADLETEVARRSNAARREHDESVAAIREDVLFEALSGALGTAQDLGAILKRGDRARWRRTRRAADRLQVRRG